MGSFTQATAHVRRLWSRLSRMQQMALIAIVAGAVVFGFLLLRMGGPQPYAVAFTNLDPKDAAASGDALKSAAIPYQVTPDGTTIKVPSSRLADARLKLASKGLPQGGAVGFELFDKTSFGITDFVQNVNYQRSLEGELQRTIDTLSAVSGSKINIVVPKQALFVTQQKPATASILLEFRPGQTLDAQALKGLSHLVARSVEGLDEKDITILDTSGKLLYDGNQGTDTLAGLSSTQLELQQKVEGSVAASVQTMLDQVVGPNKSAVRVQAQLDSSQNEQTSQTFTPSNTDVNNPNGLARSSSKVTENYNGSGPNGQQNGASPNLPPPSAGTPAAGQPYQYARNENTTNYELNSTTDKKTVPPGSVKRLSVSVLIDSSISDKDAQALQNAISAAAGIDTTRGDQLVVTTAAFSTQVNQTIPVAKPGPFDSLLRYAKVGVPLLAALIVLFIVWRLSRSAAPRRLPQTLVMAQPALTSGSAQAAYAWTAMAGADGEALGAAQRGNALEEPSPESVEAGRRRQEITDRMTNLAKANPDAIAEIIHGWMAEVKA